MKLAKQALAVSAHYVYTGLGGIGSDSEVGE